MTNFGSKYGAKFEDVFTFDSKGITTYKNLRTLYEENGADKVYTIRKLFVKNGNFGLECNAVLDDVIVNLPKHKVAEVQEMIKDAEAVEAINAGLAGFMIYQYTDRKYKKQCYGVNWVDVNPINAETLPF